MSDKAAIAEATDQLISYSINAEDVLLRRVFAGRTEGLFIDVGAEDPVNGNDFFGLYRLGWRGINIEPNADYFVQLQEQRPEDLNLQVLVSDKPSEAQAFFIVEATGLSTCDAELAASHAEHGATVHRVEMPATTLALILDATKPSHIDVLKIDVEGFEEHVLRGNDWSRYRPSLIMLEVTLPQSPVRRQTAVADFLKSVGYEFAYHDGLNDFFVEKTFVVPPDSFRPVNVFDNVVKWDTLMLRSGYDELRDRMLEVEHYAKALESERDRMGTAISATSQALQEKQQAEGRLAAELDMTSRIAIDLLSGDFEKVDMMLSQSALVPASVQANPQPVETGRDLMVLADVQDQQNPPDGDGGHSLHIELTMVQARFASVNREKERLEELVKDLRFENRRLAAGNEQLQGERLALHRALDQMRPQAEILSEARRTLAEMRHVVQDRNSELDERSREAEARLNRAHAEAARIEQANQAAGGPDIERFRDDHGGTSAGPAQGIDDSSALMLEALYGSTSWKLTRPIRVLGRLIRPPRS